MPSIADITGRRFGRLIAVNVVEERRGGKAMWRVRCDCGAEKVVSGDALRQGYTRSCGCLKREMDLTRFKPMRGAAHPQWKGGRRVSNNGYVQVMYPEHHRADPHTGYVFEHIKVFEDAHGVQVLLGWTVHHINGDRTDNRPENLELWRQSHPAGQRAEDILADLVRVLGVENVMNMVQLLKKEQAA